MNTKANPSHSAVLIPLLQKVGLWQGISDATLENLVSAAVRRTYSAGAILFIEGDPVTGLYLIESGRVKISRVSQDGREHILLLLGAGDMFNEMAALDGDPNPATATAHTDAVVHCILRHDLRQAVNQHPDLAWALIESMARRARYLVEMVQDLSMRSVKGRLAHLLLEQAQANEADAVPRMLTQEEMANRLGTVREMVGRTLRSLAAEDIIEINRHRIVILDRERLGKEAEV